MKTRYIVGLFLVGASVLSSCSDFTEIDQKGMNLLSTTDQLEMLLNQEYNIRIADIQRVCGSVQYYPGNVGTVLADPVKTTTQILLKYDEAGHALEQVDLTSSDSYYANCYNYIGTVANPILSLVDAATGSEEKKTALKAEALTIRAYFHWLAAVKFTKAYDPATADSEKSIAYVLETQDIKQPTEQLTQKEVYEYILADLDAAIELNALPQSAVNRMRFNAACPHAIKAHVLMYMQQPGEAAKEAQKALAVNSSVSDYAHYCTEAPSSAGILVKTFETPQLALAQDYFTDTDVEFFSWLTPRYYERYEQKNIQKDWFATYHTVMWMGSWETTSQVVKGALESMFGVTEGSMSYGVQGNGRVGRINLSVPQMYLILAENAIDNNLIDDAMDYLDKIRVGRFFPEDYHALKGSVTTKTEAIGMLRKVAHGENVFNIYDFITLKRWTLLDDYKEDISWTYSGTTYTLKPESTIWVFPFPKNLMEKNGNFEHNYPVTQN